MKTIDPLVPLIVVLLALSCLLWGRFATEYQHYQEKGRGAASRQVPPPFAFSLSSYSAGGERVLQALPDGVRIFTVFALRKDAETGDVTFWSEIVRRLQDDSVRFLAVCADRGCTSRLPEHDPRPFVVVTDLPYLCGRSLGAASAHNRFLLVDRSFSVLADPIIGTPAEIIGEIIKATRQRS